MFEKKTSTNDVKTRAGRQRASYLPLAPCITRRQLLIPKTFLLSLQLWRAGRRISSIPLFISSIPLLFISTFLVQSVCFAPSYSRYVASTIQAFYPTVVITHSHDRDPDDSRRNKLSPTLRARFQSGILDIRGRPIFDCPHSCAGSEQS